LCEVFFDFTVFLLVRFDVAKLTAERQENSGKILTLGIIGTSLENNLKESACVE